LIWKWLYSKESVSEKGTLYQLKNIIHRTNVPTDPSDNSKTAEDFLLVVLHAHVVGVTKSILSKDRIECVGDLAGKVIEQYIHIQLPQLQQKQNSHPNPTESTNDRVHPYAREVLTLGLIWLGFNDAIKEGDGDMVIRYWRFLLLAFKRGDSRNYFTEAINLLSQLHQLSPRLVAQLKWGRFVNIHGRSDCNISVDLHMEHLNRRLKAILRNIGPNNKPATVKQAAQAIGILSKVSSQFENEVGISKSPDHHKCKPFHKDFDIILITLMNHDMFIEKQHRCHPSFSCEYM